VGRAAAADLAEALRALIAAHGEAAVRRAVLQVLGGPAEVPAEIRWALEFLAMTFPEWPFDFARDTRLFQRVLAADRGLNLRGALETFEMYAIGDRKRPVKNWRSAFLTWCRNGKRWGKPWAGKAEGVERGVAGGSVPAPAHAPAPRVTEAEAAENRRLLQGVIAGLAGKMEMPR
jgi:hypothetical protein